MPRLGWKLFVWAAHISYLSCLDGSVVREYDFPHCLLAKYTCRQKQCIKLMISICQLPYFPQYCINADVGSLCTCCAFLVIWNLCIKLSLNHNVGCWDTVRLEPSHSRFMDVVTQHTMYNNWSSPLYWFESHDTEINSNAEQLLQNINATLSSMMMMMNQIYILCEACELH